MSNKQDQPSSSANLVRRLLRENRTMGKRLAEYEFKRMLGELSNPTLFMLDLDFPDETPAEAPVLPSILDDPVARKLPQLNVSTGSILWAKNPFDLKPLGIHIPDVTAVKLRLALRALMTAHATEPFARFVFLCDTFVPIPFLGRYKFVYEYLGTTPIERAAERAAARYGITEVRSIIGTRPVWAKNNH
jgi:hypothetical protein